MRTMRHGGPIAVVFDLAGTVVDWGSLAAANAFVAAFKRNGFSITLEEAGVDTGAGKLAYLRGMAERVAVRWEEFFGRPISEVDIRRIFDDYQAYQPEVIRDNGCSELIPPTADITRQLKDSGIRIGVTTGYPSKTMHELLRICRKQGFDPEAAVCSEDVPQGRPAPDMIHEVMKRLDVPDKACHRVIAVGDTPKDMEAGRNAGVWTVGVVRTSSLVGLSRRSTQVAEVDGRLDPLLSRARGALTEAGAHFVIDGVWDLLEVLLEIDGRVKYDLRP